MLTLYRTPDCPGCRALQAALEAENLAHRVVLVDDDREAELPAGTHPPVLVDEGTVYQGREAIDAHLHELAAFKAEWDKFQTDACYCDDEGEVI